MTVSFEEYPEHGPRGLAEKLNLLDVSFYIKQEQDHLHPPEPEEEEMTRYQHAHVLVFLYQYHILFKCCHLLVAFSQINPFCVALT